MDKYSVYSGALGWRHASWRGTFYPEDLPEDWQLAFYNTQFRCVYLPRDFWRDAPDEAVTQWLDDTQEDFRFVLQPPEPGDEAAPSLAGRFGARGVFEDRIDLLWIEDVPDVRELAQRMRTPREAGTALFLISRTAELSRLRQVSELMELLGV